LDAGIWDVEPDLNRMWVRARELAPLPDRALRGQHHAVRTWVDQGLAPVREPDPVRRGAVRTAYLDDLCHLVGFPDLAAAHMQPVADGRTHVTIPPSRGHGYRRGLQILSIVRILRGDVQARSIYYIAQY